MSTAPAQQTKTKTATKPAKTRHLYCADNHEPTTERALCGAPRNLPHTGWVTPQQAKQGDYCVVCVDLFTTVGNLCPTCRK